MTQYDISRIRKDLGLTQKELANRLRLSQGFLSSIESGRYSFPEEKVDILREVCSELNLEDYLKEHNSDSTNVEIGNNNYSSDIRINDPETLQTLIYFLRSENYSIRGEIQAQLAELKNLRDRNDKLSERNELLQDALEKSREKSFHLMEEILRLKGVLTEKGINVNI